MSEREENVYKAKLAEQAERYDGEYRRPLAPLEYDDLSIYNNALSCVRNIFVGITSVRRGQCLLRALCRNSSGRPRRIRRESNRNPLIFRGPKDSYYI